MSKVSETLVWLQDLTWQEVDQHLQHDRVVLVPAVAPSSTDRPASSAWTPTWRQGLWRTSPCAWEPLRSAAVVR